MDVIGKQASAEKEPEIPFDNKTACDSQNSTQNETIEKSNSPSEPSISSNEDLPVDKTSGSAENKNEVSNKKDQSHTGIDNSISQRRQDETKEIATKIDTSESKDTIENSLTSIEATEMKTDEKKEISNVEKSLETHEESSTSAENEECKQKPIESTAMEDNLDTTNDEPSVEDSEYETPEPDENEDEEEEEENDDDVSETGESSTGSQVLTEREEGDGEESDKKDGKKKDKDEDKRDPQYIPKKGNFYEHDDRTAELEEVSAKKPIPVKSYDSKEMWGHDMYVEDMQSPKSKQELIDQYGYDIRDEEGPPKARRRRKYGRGPNKYTRRWEEVDAYVKTRGAWRGGGRGGRGRGLPITIPDITEEFPPLPQTNIPIEKEETQETKSEEKKKEQSPLPQRKEFRKYDKFSKEKDDKREPTTTAVSIRGGKKSFRQVYLEEQVITPSRGRGRGRGRIPAGSAFRGRSSHNPANTLSQTNDNILKQSTAEEDIATLSQHFSEAVINVDNKSIISPLPQQTSKQGNAVVAMTQPPVASTVTSTQSIPTPQVTPTQAITTTVQGEKIQSIDQSNSDKNESKSKRYSTQRQRSLPQGAGPVQQPPPQRYMQDQYYHQGIDTNGGAPPPQYAQQPPPPPQPYPPEVPMMAFIPPGGQFQPLYVPPPPYIPTAPLPVQVSACHQAPPPRPEVYQGASGITYYSPQSQVNRQVNMSRRVKLAIPIVAPPESS